MKQSSLVTSMRWPRRMGVVAAIALLMGAGAPVDTRPGTGKKAAPIGPRGFNRAAIIAIDGEINDVMYKSLQRRVEQAREKDVRLIVFELDTPGGAVGSALDICELIKTLPGEIHTVAWIKPRALSAGSMISLACKEIIVSSYAQIGDCQPIMVGAQGVQAIPDDIKAKFTAPVLAEFRDSATDRGYSKIMCLAMIRPEIEVFWVENTKTGERRFVDRVERDLLFKIKATEAPETRTKEVVTEHKVRGQPVKKRETEIIRRAGGLTDHAETKSEWKAVETDERLGNVRSPIVSSDELLTMTQDEAIAFGFARAEVTSRMDLETQYDISGPIERMEFNWSEQLVNWLTNPIFRGVLMALIMLGAYVEFNSPGVGLPGLVALICLVVFLGAPYLTGLANAWEIILVALGVVLIGVEVFVIPGFGIAGIAGIILMLVGLVATFVPEEPGSLPFALPQFDYTWDGVVLGIKVIASAMMASAIGAIILSRYLTKMPVVGRIVAANPRNEDVVMPEAYPRAAFLGEVGKTVGPLRPAGKARFGDSLIDVVSQSDYIDRDEPIEVVERRGNRIVVRRVQDS